ncbi:hypothetical protein [Endozoicomonas sp.]|uniref:hypothetical protein n=1 Tax=Endozoicomonas sp. TaxID=1892382 RepID=UPI002888E154|nr:hypothetical protein [Endozoicomonas sp.]
MLMRVHEESKASFNISVVIFGWITTGAHGFFSADFIANHAQHLTSEWLSFAIFTWSLVGVFILHGDHGGSCSPGIGNSSLV